MGAVGLELRILGPFEVLVDGGLVGAGGVRQRALLAILALRPNEVVSTDVLVDQMWATDPPRGATHTVQVFVSRLRKALGPGGERLVTRPPGYSLTLAPHELDANRCEQLYEAAVSALSAGAPERTEGLLLQARALWRGPPLAEYTYEPFAQAAIARLEELRLNCREEMVQARLALGRHEQAIAELEAIVREQPLRERPRAQLMLALYRSGRQAEALEAYQHARRALIDELGVEPSDTLRGLEGSILRQDESLMLPSPSPSPSPLPAAAESDRSLVAGPAPVLPAAEVARPTRKMVTVVYCSGAVGSLGKADPELLSDRMTRLFDTIRAAIERHDGTVATVIHDAVIATFGVPRLHEDDALRAVRAAAEIRERLSRLAGDLGAQPTCRAGLSTGLVLAGSGKHVPTGDAVNQAVTLGQAAAPGEIRLTAETLQLVRDAVVVEEVATESHGDAAVPRSFRLLRLDPLAPGVSRRLDTSLVDRSRELTLLRGAWGRVIDEPGCHLFTLLGTAGVGKSRLVAELLNEVAEEATVLRGRCLHYGEGITFWPLIEALRPVGGAAKPVLERLSHGAAATPGELFWTFRQLLESLAAERPVVLHVDDLHWAEPMLLDLLDHVVELSRGASVLLVCTARPELFEARRTWAGGKLNATTVMLEPLGTNDSESLLDQLGDGLDPALRSRIVTASEGMPLFIEEMAVLARERRAVTVPASIQALLAARLERLSAGERELLEYGAVEGVVFHLDVLTTLAGERPIEQMRPDLAELVRKELIRPHPGNLGGQEAFRFRHALIQDAAYSSITKTIRADLHHRLADWLAELDELVERDELIGWHLELALRYRGELGRQSDPALAGRAAWHLHAAGRHARELTDLAAARKLFERGLALAPAGGELRERLAVDLVEQLIEAGELARADEVLMAVEAEPHLSELARLSRIEWLTRVRPQGGSEAMRLELPGILEHLARVGDERGIARAHIAARLVHLLESRATLAAEEARLAAEHARRAGDEGLRARALGLYMTSLMYGRQNADAMARELDTVSSEQLGSYLAARVELARGEVARLNADFDVARRRMLSAIELFRSLGMPEVEAASEQDMARMELSAGDPGAAVDALLRSDELLATLGETFRRSTTQAHLAQAYELLGLREPAEQALEATQALGAPDDVLNHTITHRVRARLAWADGDGDAARRWASSAVEHADLTDYVVFQAEAWLELARLEHARGSAEQAREAAAAALERFTLKGDRGGAQRAEALCKEINGTHEGPERG